MVAPKRRDGRLLLLLVEVDGRRPVISTGPRSGREKLTRTCLQCVVLVVLDDQMGNFSSLREAKRQTSVVSIFAIFIVFPVLENLFRLF